MHKRSTKLLLLGVCLAGACVVSQGGQQAAVLEPIPVEYIQQGRNALEKWEQQAAAESGVMNIILGNTCFTTAIAQMKQGCTKMDSTNRCWLAIQFTMCFQRASGFRPVDCPAMCPKYKRLQACVEDCTARMDANTYNTYTHFFSDVFNMCLFLQTQNFQEFTSALVQDMHLSTAAANTTLGYIKRDLADQRQAVMDSVKTLAVMQQVQLEVQSAVETGLSEVQKVGQLSLGLQHSMNQSLQMTDVLAGHQLSLLDGFSSLSQQHKQHVMEAAAAWQQLTEGAAALEQRQVRYESLQAQLLNASEGLLSQQQGMSSLLELLLHYQHTGSSVLQHLYSSSTTLQDLMFYSIALSVPLLFFTHPVEVRLLLLLAVLASWLLERSIMQHLVPIHRAFTPASSSSSAGMSAAAAAAVVSGGGLGLSRTPGHVQSVKVCVRFVVMGGACGLVIWWMVKRSVARRKKEEIFEDIRRSFAESNASNHHKAHMYAYHHMHPQTAAAAAADNQLVAVPQTPQSPHLVMSAHEVSAAPGIMAAANTKPSTRGKKSTYASMKDEHVLGNPQRAVALAPAASGQQQHWQQLQQQLVPVSDHSGMNGYPTSSHQTQPAPVLALQQQQQQQYMAGFCPAPQPLPATAVTPHTVAPYTPHGASTLVLNTHHAQMVCAAQQTQAPPVIADGGTPSDLRSQTACPLPPAALQVAAAGNCEGDDAAQMHVDEEQQQQHEDSAVTATGGRRASTRGTKATSVAAATGKKTAAGKKRDRGAAAAAGVVPEGEEDAAADQGDVEGLAVKKPAGRRVRRQ